MADMYAGLSDAERRQRLAQDLETQLSGYAGNSTQKAKEAASSILKLSESNSIQNAVKNANASSLFSLDKNSIANALPNTKDVFQNLTKDLNVSLNSTTNEMVKNIQKSTQNYENIANGLSNSAGSGATAGSGASSGTTTFVTNTSKESVVPFELPGLSGPFDLGSMSKDLLGRIGDFSGLSNIVNGSQLTKALSSISSEFSSQLSTVTSFMGLENNSVNGLLNNVTNTVSDVTGGFSLSDITNKISGYIPSGIKDLVSNVSNYASNMMNSVGSVLSNIPGINDIGGTVLNVLGMSSNNYNNITDLNGVQWNGIANNSSYSMKDLQKMQSSAKSVCPDIPQLSNLLDYANLKNTFDTLLALAAKNGLTDLLKNLLNCGQNIYNDSRSYDILASQISGAAKSGDINTLQVIADYAGVGRFSDPLTTVRTATTNMSKDSFSLSGLLSLSNTLNVDFDQVLRNESNNYSAPIIFAMGQSNNNAVANITNENIRNTAYAVLNQYGTVQPTDYNYIGI